MKLRLTVRKARSYLLLCFLQEARSGWGWPVQISSCSERQGAIKKNKGGRWARDVESPSYLWDSPQSTATPPPSKQLRQKNCFDWVPKEEQKDKITHCRHRCRRRLPKAGSLWCPGWFPLPWRWGPVPGSGWTACWRTNNTTDTTQMCVCPLNVRGSGTYKP